MISLLLGSQTSPWRLCHCIMSNTFLWSTLYTTMWQMELPLVRYIYGATVGVTGDLCILNISHLKLNTWIWLFHYDDDIMGAIASQITSRTIVYSTVYLDADKKKTSKLCVTGLCAGNSPGTGEFPAQMASNAENGSIWWRHHALFISPGGSTIGAPIGWPSEKPVWCYRHLLSLAVSSW